MSFPYCKFANEDNKYDKTLKMKNNTMIIACLCAVGIMNVSMLHVHENMQGTTRTRSYKVEEVVVTGTRNDSQSAYPHLKTTNLVYPTEHQYSRQIHLVPVATIRFHDSPARSE